MKMKISPSMMCADLANVSGCISQLEKGNAEYLHIDVMDGCFVPNYALGTDFIRALRKITNIPLDIHLMIADTDNKLDIIDIKENDIVSVHCESTIHLHRVLCKIKSKGAKAFVALNPATPLCAVEEIFDTADGFVIMSVNPGFAGQEMVPSTLDKARRLRALLDSKGYTESEIEIDGHVSWANIPVMKDCGANIFVTGTSGVFGCENLTEGMNRMRKMLEE